MTAMSWLYMFLGIIGTYLALGVIVTFAYFLQSPYAMNPIWVLILFWPFLLFG